MSDATIWSRPIRRGPRAALVVCAMLLLGAVLPGCVGVPTAAQVAQTRAAADEAAVARDEGESELARMRAVVDGLRAEVETLRRRAATASAAERRALAAEAAEAAASLATAERVTRDAEDAVRSLQARSEALATTAERFQAAYAEGSPWMDEATLILEDVGTASGQIPGGVAAGLSGVAAVGLGLLEILRRRQRERADRNADAADRNYEAALDASSRVTAAAEALRSLTGSVERVKRELPDDEHRWLTTRLAEDQASSPARAVIAEARGKVPPSVLVPVSERRLARPERGKA